MLLLMQYLVKACSVNWEFGWSMCALNENKGRLGVEKGRKKVEKERINQGGVCLTL